MYVEYSIEDVSKHNKKDDAWVIYRDFVYDVTHFLDIHPGGSKIISPYIGRDMTRAFESDLHKHSEYSMDILENFQIGILKGTKVDTTKEKKKTKREELREAAKVDLNQPIFLQVGHLGETYDPWVHIPIIPGKETNHIYMFQDKVNGFFEIHSYVKWWFVPLVHVPLSSLFFYYGLTETNDWKNMIYMYIFGIFLWSFIEYFLHRFLFHAHTSSRLGNTLHFIFHGVHHLDPLDPNRLVFPPFVAIITFYLPAHLIFKLIFGPWGKAVFCGVLHGYMIYDLTHYYLHHGNITFGPFNFLKKCHMHHHFFPGEGEHLNFGVGPLGKFWDFIFGTHYMPISK